MFSRIKAITSILFCADVMITATPAFAQNQDFSVEIETVPITEKIFAPYGEGGNIGLFVGEDGVFLSMISLRYSPNHRKQLKRRSPYFFRQINEVRHPRRWVIERTFGCFYWCRRLSRDYECTTTSTEAFLYLNFFIKQAISYHVAAIVTAGVEGSIEAE